MTRNTQIATIVFAIIVAVVLALCVFVFAAPPPAYVPIRAAYISTALLTRAIPDAAPNAAQLRRGQYLVRAGDCISCHTRAGGAPFAGGLALGTPFGVIYSTNLTSHPRDGIGALPSDQ